MSFLAALSLAQGAMQFAGAYSQSRAAKAQAKYQKSIYDTNAYMSELQAEDALSRGNTEARRVQGTAERVRGTQRAGYAAQGVAVNSGTPAAIQQESATMGELDALTVKNNAWREAWGYRVQADDLRARGDMALRAGRNEAGNTILTGGMNALSSVVQGYGNATRYGSPAAGTGPRVPNTAPRARRVPAQGWRKDY